MDDVRFLDLRTELLKVPSTCAAIVVVLEVLPVGNLPAAIRLPLAMGYFGALLALLWFCLTRLEEYLNAFYSWRYQDAGPALEKTWKLYLHSLRQTIRPIVWSGLVFVGCLGLKTLAHWPAFASLRAFAPLYEPGWILGGIALLGYPFFGGYLLTEAYHRHRLLVEQSETDDVEPKKVQALRDLAKETRAERPPVEALGPLQFRAGGFEWSWDDFYKNAIVFGAPGTGKTVCVLNAVLEGLLASATGELACSGLILDPKGDFHEKLGRLCKRYGREKDLLVLDPHDSEHSIRWNPLDSSDDELELAGRFGAVLESTGMKSDKESFWVDSAKKFLRHAITLLRDTNPPGEPPTFAQVAELATSFEGIAARTELLDPTQKRASRTLAFFADEWMQIADETRTSIQSHLTNMLDPFLMEPYESAFTGTSTMRIEDMVEQGKILYVHMPIADKEVMARVIGAFTKLEFNREILKRPDKERPSFFLCDEFQAFLTQAPGRGDADFFERSRQSNHANLIATQNLPALKKVLAKDAHVMNLLSNCAVKLFLRNPDAETNRYASELFGQKLVAFASQNLGGGGQGVRVGGAQGANVNYDAKVRQEVFAQLTVPSRADSIDFAEAIGHLGSRSRVSKKRLRWKVHPLSA